MGGRVERDHRRATTPGPIPAATPSANASRRGCSHTNGVLSARAASGFYPALAQPQARRERPPYRQPIPGASRCSPAAAASPPLTQNSDAHPPRFTPLPPSGGGGYARAGQDSHRRHERCRRGGRVVPGTAPAGAARCTGSASPRPPTRAVGHGRWPGFGSRYQGRQIRREH